MSFVAVTLAGIPLLAQQPQPAQRGGPPNQDTPYILVATCQSTDRKLGVDAADEIRHRLQGEHSAKELFVITKNSINSTLEASGYRPDSALNSSDLMELSKQLHGEYVLDCKAAKGATKDAAHVESRILLRTAQQTLAQPLPAVDGKDPGDAAKGVERNVSDFLKGVKPYQTCIADLRAGKNDQAMVDARAGIAAYPNSSLSRICLLNAYANAKSSPDSIISVSNQILGIDPTNLLALANLAEAYQTKGDKDKVIETNLRIYRADPSNATIAQTIVQGLAQSGAPDKALPIVDTLLKDNPADPQLLRTKWQLQLAAASKGDRSMYKQAIATGEELVKIDTAQATVDFFNRQLGAAQADSNTAKVQEIAAKAGQKYPKDPSFALVLAQSYRKTGQLQQALQQAERATQIDPKNTNAWMFAIVTANDLNQPDTVLALAQKAAAAGVDKQTLSQAILGPAGAALKKAQDSKTRADWEAALKMAETVDGIAPSAQAKFYIGVSSFQVAVDILNDVQTLAKSKKKDEQAKACTESKEAEDYLAKTSIAMPAGGSVDKGVAGQILNATTQYGEFIAQVKKAFCK